METVVRTLLIYGFILVALRLVGKREFGQLSPVELVTLLIIPEMVSQALTRDDYSLTNAIIAVTTLLVLVYATSLLSQRSKRAELILTGVPTVLIKQGEFISANLAKERVTPDEVFSEMHKAGMYDLRQIKWAILEGDGKIAFIPEDLAKHPQLLHKKMQDESALS